MSLPTRDLGAPARILLVEDDATIATGLAEFLRRRGYAVAHALDGRAALAILETAPVELVISDIFMPDMDGLELLTCLRRLAPDVPLLAMSGYGRLRFDAVLRMAGALGAVHTLAKPFAPSQLLEVVQQLVGPPGLAPVT